MAKTILLADDSVTIQKVVELTFMDEDFRVIAVNDGAAALGKLSEVKPDLVISDVHMPGASGYEVCRKVKAAIPGIPVLLLVGTFEPYDEDKAAAVDADGHLKKPFDSQDLLQKVRDLIAASDAPPVSESPEAAPFAAIDTPAPAAPATAVEPPAAAPVAVESVVPLIPTPAEERAPTEVTPPDDLPAVSEDIFETGAEMAAEPPAEVAGDTVEAFAPSIESLSPEETPLALDETGSITAPVFEEPAAAVEPLIPEPVAEVAPEPEAAVSTEAAVAETAASNGSHSLSDEDVDRIARRVVELAGKSVLREVAWEVVPDLAEVVIKERIRELESQVE